VRRLKKGCHFFQEKSAPPEKILAMPMNLPTLEKSCGRPCPHSYSFWHATSRMYWETISRATVHLTKPVLLYLAK